MKNNNFPTIFVYKSLEPKNMALSILIKKIKLRLLKKSQRNQNQIIF